MTFRIYKIYKIIAINLLLVIATLLSPVTLNSKTVTGKLTESNMYKELEKIDSKTLLSEADLYLSLDTFTERALISLSIVTNRYYLDQEDKELRRDATHAFNSIGTYYHVAAIDFCQSYKYLMTARQIAEEDSNYQQLAWTYLSLSNLFHNSNTEKKLSSYTRDYMNKGMEFALRCEDTYTISVIVLGMASSSFSEKSWGNFRTSISQFVNYANKNHFKGVEFFINTINACNAYLQGDLIKAEMLLNKAKERIDNSVMQGKIYELNIDDMLFKVYKDSKVYDKAISISKYIANRSRKYNLPVYALPAYQDLSDVYNLIGMPDSANYYYNRYLMSKDTMENQAGFRSVEQLKLLSEIDSVNNEIAQFSINQRKEQKIRIIGFTALIVLTLFLIVLIWLHKKLRKSNSILFKRNEDMVKLLFQHKLQHQKWDDEKALLLSEIDTLKNDSRNEVREDITEQSGEKEKPQEEMEFLKRIYTRVLDYMETSEEIYNTEFSLHRLSEALNINIKNVSAAINTYNNSNFRHLLNEFRIQEVMRLMAEGGAETLTIEAIANSAGFSSRTSFSNLFKKITGITPSEYIKSISNKKVKGVE